MRWCLRTSKTDKSGILTSISPGQLCGLVTCSVGGGSLHIRRQSVRQPGKSLHVPHPSWSLWFVCTARAEWVGKLTSIPCQRWALLTALHALASGPRQIFRLTEREDEKERNRLKATEKENPFNMGKRAFGLFGTALKRAKKDHISNFIQSQSGKSK